MIKYQLNTHFKLKKKKGLRLSCGTVNVLQDDNEYKPDIKLILLLIFYHYSL